MSLTPGVRHYTNKRIKLGQIADVPPVINGVTFERCKIVGPAVVASVDNQLSLTRCIWDAPFESLLWVLPEGPKMIVGAIGLSDCHFFDCTFEGVGLAIPEPMVEHYRAGFST